jgi:hypothetical protein
MKFAAIIPTRGTERTVFTARQMGRAYDMGYDKIYLIDYPPVDDKMDLYQRIAVGISKAIADGIDFCSIIEDDDWYGIGYLSKIKEIARPTIDIIGFSDTTYYHLKTKGVLRMDHPGRSSMFCTTIKTSTFALLPVDPPGYLDMAWWKAAANLSWRLVESNRLALGIKHGIGKTGGNGHRAGMYRTHDPNFLRRFVDEESFIFYEAITKTL